MLGKGLESLIPSGGYKKPEEPSANSGQNFSVGPADYSKTNLGQTSSAEHSDLPQEDSGQTYSADLKERFQTNSPQTNLPQAYPVNSEQTGAVVYPPNYYQNHSEEKSQQSYVNPTAPILPQTQQPAFNQGHDGARRAYPIEESEIKPMVKPIHETAEEADYSRGQASVFQIEVEKIFPNPHQPRRHFDEDSLNELANSIREFGIIQPLVVTKVLKETENGTEVTYQLIAGERRLMAAKKVGLRTVPSIIKRISVDRERLELAIIENIQREDLNPLEAARSYARLQDEFGLTQREIATRMGKSRETIANTLRLLNLPSEIQQALEDGKINESHARLLLQIDDIARQRDMFQSILHSRPSVRELKTTIKNGRATHLGNYLNPELISLQSRLEEFLGTKAKIDDNGGKGKITITYYSPEELSALIARLSGEEF